MLNRAKFLGLISGLVVVVAACSDGTQSSTNSNQSANTATNVSSNEPTGQKLTTPPTNISSLGVKAVKEIKFQTPSGKGLSGFFDTVNNGMTLKHNVSKNGTVTLSGWAIIPEKTKAAEKVIVTLPDTNQVVAIANVNMPRPDVVKVLKNEAYKNSGWTTSFKGNSLPTGRVVLKAWAYDPATKTATLLKNIHELTVSP